MYVVGYLRHKKWVITTDSIHTQNQQSPLTFSIFISTYSFSMKCEGIDSNIASQLEGLKSGSHRNVSAATAPISSASNIAASYAAHKTESRHLLNASALHHGKEKENTPPLGSSLASSRDDELDIPFLGPSEPAANNPEEPARQIHKWKLKYRVSITRQRSNVEQMHAATMRPASSPPLAIPTAALLDNLLVGAPKTPTSQPKQKITHESI